MTPHDNDHAVANIVWIITGLLLFFLVPFMMWALRGVFSLGGQELSTSMGGGPLWNAFFLYVMPIGFLIIFLWTILARPGRS